MAKGKKTGGRVSGTPNKATAEIKDLARAYTSEAMAELGRLALGAESEAARVAAIRELFDRGHGKPTQSIGLGQAPDLPAIQPVVRPSITREEWLRLYGTQTS